MKTANANAPEQARTEPCAHLSKERAPSRTVEARVMNSASRRASFHAAPVVVIADRREHMISPAYSFGHTQDAFA